MPLVLEKLLPSGCLGVWHILETEEALRNEARAFHDDIAEADSFKNESRRKQWLACRALLSHLLQLPFVKVCYDVHGKPSLEGYDGNISFSHTGEYAAVLVNQEGPAGVDIEKLAPRIERVANRFLQEDELMHIGMTAERQMIKISPDAGSPPRCHPHTELLYLYWCTKEALYKFYGKPSLDLKNDIYIVAFDYFCSTQATFTARVNLPEGVENHELQFEKIEDHMLVYTLFKQG